MSETGAVPTTITEQIYAMMLSDLADDEAFDEATVKKVQELIEKDMLTNRGAVLNAIQVQPGAAS